jgi:hypothetical protein
MMVWQHQTLSLVLLTQLSERVSVVEFVSIAVDVQLMLIWMGAGESAKHSLLAYSARSGN